MKLNGYIAFDNGGGAALMCGVYAHCYDDGKQLAADVLAIICGANPWKDWDGNDEELRRAMRSADLSQYDKVLHLVEVREILADPSRVKVEFDWQDKTADGYKVSVDSEPISGCTLSTFWRTISAN